jgi:cytochrome c2
MQYKSAVLGGKVVFLALALAFPISMLAQAKADKHALSASAKAGQKLFNASCTVCHYDNQTKTKIGPGLKGLFKAKELPYSHKPVTEANVRAQIEKGNPNGTPMPMPAFGSTYSKTDIDNLIAFLKTL